MNHLAWVSAAALAASAAATMLFTTGHADDETALISGIQMPPGYRDWKLISVAREVGDLNDLRAVLGNDIAIQAYRDGTRRFPDGTIIVRLAWGYVPSEENDKVFGRHQSFVAGAPKEGVQSMIKDAAQYASTGGWGSPSSTTANRLMRQCLRHASPATSPRNSMTSFTRAMRLNRAANPAMLRKCVLQ